MINLAMDVGTYNLVSCRRGKDNEFVYNREVNAFIEVRMDDKFTFNMMRTTLNERGEPCVPLIEWEEAGIAYALGEAALKIAYSMNLDVKRPMFAGCLNPKEKHAQQIMNIMVHGLVGDLQENGNLYYSIPANAINEETDADYHSLVVKSMFDAYSDDQGHRVTANPINEALALIYAELANKAYTGIGISFGAGMVNLCFAIFGAPVFQFSLANSGDWIDRQAAKATGEGIAFINKEKTNISFLEQNDSPVHKAIKAQYEILLHKTIAGIKDGIEKSGKKARTDKPIDIVVAGGTSLPPGFDKLFGDMLKKANLPLELGAVIRPEEPLYSVARGCLLAAEAAAR